MKKCVHCEKKSIPGLKKGQGLCQYHYDTYMFGRKWADHCRVYVSTYTKPTKATPKVQP